MGDLADLLRPKSHTLDEQTPQLMAGYILDLSPLRVEVPAFDGGRTAFRAFGTPPEGAAVGDEVRVQIDSSGGFVLVAWETSA